MMLPYGGWVHRRARAAVAWVAIAVLGLAAIGMAPAALAAAAPTASGQAAAPPPGQATAPAGAQAGSAQEDQLAYPTLAEQPDPASFVKRAETGLVVLGAPQRFAGADLPWLGLRRNAAGGWQRTTAYEIRDAFRTVTALGGTVVRAAGLAGTAGCALCLEPSENVFSKDAFAVLDQALKSANDLGIRLILPLAGGPGNCGEAEAPLGLCGYLRWHGGNNTAAFFTDPAMRDAFFRHVRAVVSHVNTLTGVAYKNDPAILAWENCTACGAGADPVAVGIWTEGVGQAIRSVDHFHLYENGALPGHIRPGVAGAVPADVFAPPSVDVVGDASPPAGDEAALRHALAEAAGAVAAAGRAYAIDTLQWDKRVWATPEALHVFLEQVVRERGIAFALIPGLQGHADQGGFIQPPQAEESTPLYYPALPAAGESKEDMEARVLMLRHFAFDMAEVTGIQALPLPASPEIIDVRDGTVRWRGGAGAASYSVERSADPSQPFSWETLCDHCAVTDQSVWRDPSPPAGPVFYRVLPFNQNGHQSLPSPPVRNQAAGKP